MSKDKPAVPEVNLDEGGFLSRWSRRKREVKAEDVVAKVPPAQTPPAAEEASATSEVASGLSEAEKAEAAQKELDELIASLPKVEEITASTDVTGFLDKRIPDMLRNAALRATWSSDPGIRDFLNDAREYALDYNTPGAAPGYGLLSDSERADAAEFVKTLFSDAPATDAARQTSNHTLVEEKSGPQSEDSDQESQIVPQPEIAASHNGLGVTIPPEPMSVLSSAIDAGNSTDSGHEHAVLPAVAPQHMATTPGEQRHDVTASPSDQTVFRRRGGSALPI